MSSSSAPIGFTLGHAPLQLPPFLPVLQVLLQNGALTMNWKKSQISQPSPQFQNWSLHCKKLLKDLLSNPVRTTTALESSRPVFFASGINLSPSDTLSTLSSSALPDYRTKNLQNFLQTKDSGTQICTALFRLKQAFISRMDCNFGTTGCALSVVCPPGWMWWIPSTSTLWLTRTGTGGWRCCLCCFVLMSQVQGWTGKDVGWVIWLGSIS